MNDNRQKLIIPLCIYHYIDSNTKTYMGYIDKSLKTIASNLTINQTKSDQTTNQ